MGIENGESLQDMMAGYEPSPYDFPEVEVTPGTMQELQQLKEDVQEGYGDPKHSNDEAA